MNAVFMSVARRVPLEHALVEEALHLGFRRLGWCCDGVAVGGSGLMMVGTQFVCPLTRIPSDCAFCW